MKCLVLIASLLLSSCSFNRRFYEPDKFHPKTTRITILEDKTKDTVAMKFEGKDHTISVRNTRDQPIDLGYTVESSYFTSGNGHRLYALMLKPRDVKPRNITLLFLHGNGGNFLSQIAFALPLVKQGFQLLLVDYSGYGFSTGRPTRKGMLVDAESALRFLKSRDDIKDTKVVIYGQSMGAQLAATVAMLHPNDIDGLVMEGSPSSHKDIAAHRFPHDTAFAKFFVRERYSATSSVRQYHKPLLVIHSTEDQDAPFNMGLKIFRNANEPKQFYQVKGPHLYAPVKYADSIAAKISRMVGE